MWVKVDDDKFCKFVWIIIFLIFDFVMFGGFMWLIDLGFGCFDWLGCYGMLLLFIVYVVIMVVY